MIRILVYKYQLLTGTCTRIYGTTS